MMADVNHKMKIYIAAHKAFTPPADATYQPIQVGRALASEDLGIPGDDTGDNISLQNPYYCELTALYWIWKNDAHDITGLVHYRRYFYNHQWQLLTGSEAEEMLQSTDLIVAQRGYNVPGSVRDRYDRYHVAADVDTARDALRRLSPSYLPAFDRVWNGHSYCPYNMMIARRGVVNDYCSWLFPLLRMAEKQMNPPLVERDTYNCRALGFLGERLLNVWLEGTAGLHYTEVPVLNVEQNLWVQKTVSRIKDWIR